MVQYIFSFGVLLLRGLLFFIPRTCNILLLFPYPAFVLYHWRAVRHPSKHADVHHVPWVSKMDHTFCFKSWRVIVEERYCTSFRVVQSISQAMTYPTDSEPSHCKLHSSGFGNHQRLSFYEKSDSIEREDLSIENSATSKRKKWI